MWAVVLAVGIPAAIRYRLPWHLSLRNPTAFALTFLWLVAETVALETEDNLPLATSFKVDVTVIMVIYAKTIVRCGAKAYPSLPNLLRCMVTDLTAWDRWIVAIYLLGVWPLYVLDIHPYYKWYALWALTIVQFLLAGGESLARFRDAKREALKPPPIIDRHLRVLPSPIPCRAAEAVRIPAHAGDLLIANGGRGYG